MPRISAAAFIVLAFCAPSMAAEILVHDPGSRPESLTVTPDGAIITGSAGSPFIYRIRKGATAAEVFVDASGEKAGTSFQGQLADAATTTLWSCEATVKTAAVPDTRTSVLRGFDLNTGRQKLRWDLPGPYSACNDLSIGPDRALYFTDTINARIFRLAAGARTPELFLEHKRLASVNGITFLNATMYVSDGSLNHIYRIPVDVAGKPGEPVDLLPDTPIKGPDGLRAANGKLFVAENRGGRVSMLTVAGDTAHVTVIKDGLDAPSGIEPAGDTLWFTDRGAGKVLSVPMPE